MVRALSLEELQTEHHKSNSILNNWWIIEKKRRLIPFVKGRYPGSGSPHILIEEIQDFYGDNFAIVHIPVAYLPRNFI